MSQHKAALLPAVNKKLEIRSISTPSPSSGEVLIRTKAMAINPVDYYIQDTGQFVKSLPMILGSDVAGEVVGVGDSISNPAIKKGCRVLAAATYLASAKKENSGFQELVLLPEIAVCPIPDSLTFEEASVLPLSVSTAAAGLYADDFLGLPLPTQEPKSSGKKILVWGGSGSVGSSAVQLAVASGLEVIVTASPKNFDYVKSLVKGFSDAARIKVFDYKSLSVVGDIVEALGDDCVGAYDAIGTQETQLQIATILAQLGGGKIATVLPPPEEGIPATVTTKFVFAVSIFTQNPEIGSQIFNKFLPQALSTGKFIAAPEAEVVGRGLESLQGAMERHKGGVSARKIVVGL